MSAPAVRNEIIHPDTLWRLQPHTFARVVSEGEFRTYKHISFIGREIAKAVAKGYGRLIINLPPGHGKSWIASKWTPTWFLENWPRKRVVLACYGEDLALDWGRAVRDEFDSNPRLHNKLDPDSNAANRWNTTEGGGMTVSGIGGPILGRRAELLIVDDPIKNYEEAQSPSSRQRVINWFKTVLYTRQEPGATIIILMHRMHEEDLAGYLINNHADEWKVIEMPAMAERINPDTGEDRGPDPLGRREGEPLCPERFDKRALEMFRRSDEAVWGSMYQQRPRSGNMGRLYCNYGKYNLNKRVQIVGGLPLDVSFDFNRNPGMHIEIGQYFPQDDLFTTVHEVFKPYMALAESLKELTKLINTYTGGGRFRWPKLHVYGDATGRQRRAEVTKSAYDLIIEWAAENHYPMKLRVPKANPPQKTRVDTVNQALRDNRGEVHWHIHPDNCPRLVADLKNMRDQGDGLIDKSDEQFSHPSDAEGYRIVRVRPIRRVKMTVGRVGVSR